MKKQKVFKSFLTIATLLLIFSLCCGCAVEQDIEAASATPPAFEDKNISMRGEISGRKYTNQWLGFSFMIPENMQIADDAYLQKYNLAIRQAEQRQSLYYELYAYPADDTSSLELLITVEEGTTAQCKAKTDAYETFLKNAGTNITTVFSWQEHPDYMFLNESYSLSVCDVGFYQEDALAIEHRTWFMFREKDGQLITLCFSANKGEQELEDILLLLTGDKSVTTKEETASTQPPEETGPPAAPLQSKNDVPYTIPLGADVTIIYDGPGYQYNGIDAIGENGVYTIVEEQFDSRGNLWGRLQSGIGWVCITDHQQAGADTGANGLCTFNPLKFSSEVDGRVYDISFVFEENGTVYFAYGESSAGAIGGGLGTYTVENGTVTLSIKTSGKWEEYVYEFSQTGTLIFVQKSDKGIFGNHQLGDVFYLEENTEMTKAKVKEIATYYEDPVEDLGI